MTLHVVLQNDLIEINVPTSDQFQTWINAVFLHIEDHIPKQVNEVCIRIVNKKESAELNKNFRKKASATNVLSFPNERESADDESLGDIALCAEVVESEANEQGISLLHHWAHLTIHGILHLLGYEHYEENDATEMENLEIQILNSLGIENPYEN